jgi:DNA repair protein RecO (recombination protein O)
MIEWQDDGVVLASRPHGERDAIVSILTFEHGRHLGLVRGGAGRRQSPLLQPGNRLQCVWKARLADHLGHFVVEPVRLYAAVLLEDPRRLAAVASATALLEACLAEREPHPRLCAGLVALLGRLSVAPDWPEDYVRFELLLAADLGFALDLGTCAVTGTTEDLAFVSPRTGRAVSRAAAGPYESRLLPLPPFLLGQGAADDAQMRDGLGLPAHFLRRHTLGPADRPLPLARERFRTFFENADEKPHMSPA